MGRCQNQTKPWPENTRKVQKKKSNKIFKISYKSIPRSSNEIIISEHFRVKSTTTTAKMKLLFILPLFATLISAKEVFLGQLFGLSHGVGGKIYALDDRTIVLRELNYDGFGPDAYFWAGKGRPSLTGFKIPDETGSTTPLKKYRNANVRITLPQGKTLRDIDYIGLYCKKFQENFGSIRVNMK